MSTNEALRGFYEELDRATWIEPDAELDAMGSEAKRFIEERADEHFAALAPWRDPKEPALATRLWITRDPAELARRWDSEWHAERRIEPESLRARIQPARMPPVLPLPTERAWSAALARSDGDLAKRAGSPERVAAVCDDVAKELRARLPRVGARSATWSASPFARLRPIAGPFAALYCCARDLAVPFRDPEARSPRLPLVALWNRGAWPFALPNATLGVFVPRGASPSAADAVIAAWRTVRAWRGSSTGYDPNTNDLGFGLPALPDPLPHIVRGPLAPPELPLEAPRVEPRPAR